jgi:hypothetical protein
LVGSDGPITRFVLGKPATAFVFLAASGLPGPLGALGRFAEVSVAMSSSEEGITVLSVALERATVSYDVIPSMLGAIDDAVAIFASAGVLVDAGPVTDSRGRPS